MRIVAIDLVPDKINAQRLILLLDVHACSHCDLTGIMLAFVFTRSLEGDEELQDEALLGTKGADPYRSYWIYNPEEHGNH